MNVWTVRQKNGFCREEAFGGGVMPKIVKTQPIMNSPTPRNPTLSSSSTGAGIISQQ